MIEVEILYLSYIHLFRQGLSMVVYKWAPLHKLKVSPHKIIIIKKQGTFTNYQGTRYLSCEAVGRFLPY